jgi:DNA-binding IclR family transcriptional regulator
MTQPAAASAFQSLEKAFRVLELLGERSPRGVSEIADELGLDKSGVSRLLEALAEMGCAKALERRGQYGIGPRVLALAGSYLRDERLALEAAPILRELALAGRASAHLAVWVDGQALIIGREPSPERIQIAARLGARLPLHASALGKVLLAAMPTDDLAAALDAPLQRFTDRTITGARALRAALAEVRERGYATEAEEEHPGVGCLAAPVRDAQGLCLAAMSLAGPVQGTPFRLDAAHARLVADAAAELGRRVGTAAAPRSPQEPSHA